MAGISGNNRSWDKERNSIRVFMKNLGQHYPDPEFETDACSFLIGGEEWLFSTDEFSSEDNFRSHNAYHLGWNVTSATISDILAAGGVPAYYGHSVTIQENWDDAFIRAFSSGIAHCIDNAGAVFLGGDMGVSDKWKYTGIALGKKLAGLTRRGAKAGDSIYMTGSAGAGNLEAALKLYSGHKSVEPLLERIKVVFPVRMKEAVLVRKYASCCIDSSDGLFRAVSDLARIGNTGFRISKIPYNRQGLFACKILGKPETILFLGECGEYELVFTISTEKEKAFISDARDQGLSFSRLGAMTDDQQKILEMKGEILDLSGYSIYSRNYTDVREYITRVVQYIDDGSG